MPRYRITLWPEYRGGTRARDPKPLAIREESAANAGRACDKAAWKIGQCSIEMIEGPLSRWEHSKNRIFKAYERTPTGVLFIWRDMPFLDDAHNMDDIQILDALAGEIEFMADVLRPDETPPVVSEYLSDTYLFVTFALWRVFSASSERIRTECRFCDREGEMFRWDMKVSIAIEEDKPVHVFVCPNDQKCWDQAIQEGYRATGENRRRMVSELANAGNTQAKISRLLHISRSTISKDLRLLNQKGDA